MRYVLLHPTSCVSESATGGELTTPIAAFRYSVRGVLVPERSDHVHEHPHALALDRGRVGTLDERKNLVQPLAS